MCRFILGGGGGGGGAYTWSNKGAKEKVGYTPGG